MPSWRESDDFVEKLEGLAAHPSDFVFPGGVPDAFVPRASAQGLNSCHSHAAMTPYGGV